MNKFILCLILALAAPAAAADLASATHFFPIASRTDGLAGTTWTTSVRIANPHEHALTVTVRLSTAGSFLTETVIVPPLATVGWSDFLDEVFGFDGNAAVLLEAEATANPQAPDGELGFAASMRIATVGADGGSYGQGIVSLEPITGFLGDWVAYFPAVRLHGRPGVDGFRTNVGVWNIGADPAQLRLKIFDGSGALVRQEHLTAARHEPLVMALPRTLDLDTATLTVEPLNGWVDCAVYISVVDNLTGDATFSLSQLVDPAPGAGHAVSAVGGRGSVATPSGEGRRLRNLFVGRPQ